MISCNHFLYIHIHTGAPVINDLVFQLDTVSSNPPTGPPVFTLTCNSSGGPATTVTWKRDNTNLTADGEHVMTTTLVDQSGPKYTSTLTVTGRSPGIYNCTVRNPSLLQEVYKLKVQARVQYVKRCCMLCVCVTFYHSPAGHASVVQR